MQILANTINNLVMCLLSTEHLGCWGNWHLRISQCSDQRLIIKWMFYHLESICSQRCTKAKTHVSLLQASRVDRVQGLTPCLCTGVLYDHNLCIWFPSQRSRRSALLVGPESTEYSYRWGTSIHASSINNVYYIMNEPFLWTLLLENIGTCCTV